MTDELDLDALKAKAEAATPGPWTADCCSAANMVYDRSDSIGVDATREDAEFIAAANPATVLALIERVKTAEDATCEHMDGNYRNMMAERDSALARVVKVWALAAEVQEANHADGRTHYESCWKYHAGCFAAEVRALTEGDEG